MSLAQIAGVAVNLIGKAVMLAARWTAASRRRGLGAAAARPDGDKDREIIFLKDRVAQLQSQVEILRLLYKPDNRMRYSIRERLMIIFHLTYFDVPRRRVTECFGIARATLYRWLAAIAGSSKGPRRAWNRTAADIAALVWGVAQANVNWGRVRLANQVRLLGVFVSPSTVRSILSRPKPSLPAANPVVEAKNPVDSSESQSIPACYPNHVWSVDLTQCLCWGLWRVYVIVAIDHFSGKIVSVRPLASQSALHIIEALEEAFRTFGPPRHIISDRGTGFDSDEMTEFLKSFGVKQRFGAIGEHGSIAVTERVNRTLKEEWLRRVLIIGGIAHLAELFGSFAEWHNQWRPHMTLGGCRPADFYRRETPEPVAKDAKVVPLNIERRHFVQTRVTGFRLREAA